MWLRHISSPRVRLLIVTVAFLLLVAGLLLWITRPPVGSTQGDLVGPDAAVGKNVSFSAIVRSQPSSDVVMVELDSGDTVRVEYAPQARRVRFADGSRATFSGTLTSSGRVDDAHPTVIGPSKYWEATAEQP